MRLILATMGTLGDHLPMVGLGCALQRRGYDVVIACNRAQHDLARRAGLKAAPFGRPLDASLARDRPSHWDHWQQHPSQVSWTAHDQQRVIGQVEDLLAVLEPEDVLIGTRNLPLLSLIAQLKRCRWVEVGVNSGSMIDYELVSQRLPEPHPWRLGLEALERELREQLLGDREDRQAPAPLLRLHAVPDSFVPRDYPQLPCHRTGFWTYEDPRWQQWSPPDALASILRTATAPLGLAFSSQPLTEPMRVLRQHLEVAERLNQPLLVVKGWAFPTLASAPELGRHPALVPIDPLPFRWLFSRLDTAFIHGGMGTLAAALTGGCRLVIEPFGNDQFLNARLALEQGLAWAVHPHRFDPKQVAALLDERAPSPPRPRAPDHDREEANGIERAVELLAGVC